MICHAIAFPRSPRHRLTRPDDIPYQADEKALALLNKAETATRTLDLASIDYHVSGLPTEYLIGKDGKIIASFHDAHLPPETLDNAVKAALGP